MLTLGKGPINGRGSWGKSYPDAGGVGPGGGGAGGSGVVAHLLSDRSREHRAEKRQGLCPLESPWLVWQGDRCLNRLCQIRALPSPGWPPYLSSRLL